MANNSAVRNCCSVCLSVCQEVGRVSPCLDCLSCTDDLFSRILGVSFDVSRRRALKWFLDCFILRNEFQPVGKALDTHRVRHASIQTKGVSCKDTRQYPGVRLYLWFGVICFTFLGTKCFFISITAMSTMIRNDSMYSAPIYESRRSV